MGARKMLAIAVVVGVMLAFYAYFVKVPWLAQAFPSLYDSPNAVATPLPTPVENLNPWPSPTSSP